MDEPGGQSGPGPVRIGTDEREQAVSVLGEHFAKGRLAMGEYEQRVDAANQAVTAADLAELFNDLPQPYPAFLAPAPPPLPPPPPPGQLPVTPYAYPGAVARVSDRSRLVAGVLNIVLPFGIGRFYAGDTGLGVAQLLVTLFTFGAGAIWPFIDGIVLLASGGYDGYGRRLRD